MTVPDPPRAIDCPRYGTDEYRTHALLTSEGPLTPPEATPDAADEDEDEDEDDGGIEDYFPDPHGLDLPLGPLAFRPHAGLPDDWTAADYILLDGALHAFTPHLKFVPKAAYIEWALRY